MPKKRRFSTEQIIMKLREAEVLIAQGYAVPEVARQLGVSKQTYYRWRQEYGGLDTTRPKSLGSLSKRMVA